MPAAKGWKVNRTGGGTYEFSQDAQGKYKLNSIGFQKFGKLNLPELKTEATKTTTTPKDTKTASDQTQKAFGDVQPFYYKGGGADEQYIDEYKIKKDKSLDTEPLVDAADAGTDWGTTTDAGKQQYWSRGQWGPQVDTKPVYIKSKGKADIKRADQIGKDMGGGRDSYTPRIPDRISSPLRPAIGTRVPDRISSPLRPAIEKTKPTNTALKAVNTTSNTLSKAFNFTFKAPAMMLIDAIAGSDPIQQGYNQRNQEAFSALGYKTRGELGSNRDPGRIAGNPAHNVFAGMNMVSMKGDVMRGARKRVATRTKTAERNKNKWSQEKKERFDKKTQEFKDQIQEVQGKKNQQDLAKGGLPPSASSGGGGNGNGCFLKGTQVIMADGSTKAIDKVDLGDNVAKGGKVFAVGRFLNTELYDYKGIKVSGSHMVNEDGIWMRVRDTKHGISLGNDLNTVYVFGSENRRILINDILFTDYFEVNEQDKLVDNPEDFFSNWKDYGNNVDVDNVATLNMTYEI